MKQQLISLASQIYVQMNRQARLVVMTLHRVGEGSPIKPEHIHHHLAFLARHCEMVTPSELSALRSQRTVAMATIDDCHKSIYEHIFPVAKSLNVPVTICVPTDFFFRNRWLWFDQLNWMLENASLGTEVKVEGRTLRVGDPPSVARIKALLKRKLPAERERLLASLAQALGCAPPLTPVGGYEPVAQVEMKEMLSSGLAELCAHSVTHTIATVLPDEALRQELVRSKAELEQFCGREVPTFCYPNGAIGDFDERTTRMVKAAGYKIALTMVEGTNPLARLDPYRIRRIHAHSLKSVFEKDASGLGDLQRLVLDKLPSSLKNARHSAGERHRNGAITAPDPAMREVKESAAREGGVVSRLHAMAIRGLVRMYDPAEGLFVFRLRPTESGIVSEGRSRRYTAISLIGLAAEEPSVADSVLGGQTLHSVCERLERGISQATNLGDIALSIWAASAVGYPHRQRMWRHLAELEPAKRSYPVVELAWALDAACIDPNLDRGLGERLARRLISSFSERSGVFPHMLGMNGGLRAHVSCFADMVYPIHALANYSRLSANRQALEVATQCAEKICQHQGKAGQWFWHYDQRTGDLVEAYPVYAVHQDAMAPMALFALKAAGGRDFSEEIARGLDWLIYSPEIGTSLIDEEADLIWRKVARCEPGKLSRYLQAGASHLQASFRVPGLDALVPPRAIDYEDRPYHLGWLLHAWPQARAALWDSATNPVTNPRSSVPTVSLFGVPIHAATMSQVLDRIDTTIAQRESLRIGVVNAAKVVYAHRDPRLRQDLLSSNLILADGMSVVWASRILGQPVPERVTGIDLMMGMLRRSDELRYRIYCLGASEEISQEVVRRITFDYPHANCVGRHHGYFCKEEEEQIAHEIAAARPDILLVGMTSPRKENFLAHWSGQIGVPVCHGVGGAFDVLTCKVKRAPEAWQRLGLEWLYRLKQEPRRLWRRYLVTNTLFCGLVCHEYVRSLWNLSELRSRGHLQ